MHISHISSILVAALYLLESIQAKEVFAHYMVLPVTETHAQQDIDNAISIGLDGFVLNVGDPTQSYVATTLGYLFGYAAPKDFRVLISMDVDASSTACAAGRACCNGPNDYDPILTEYLGNAAYHLGPNGSPMISTFSAGGLDADTWTAWKNAFASDMYFIPMFDDTSAYYAAASGWWSYWGGLVDGLFSWEAAWPAVGDTDLSSIGDIALDLPVMDAAVGQQKGYMIALSTLQYKDAYDANLYRAGELNLPVRISNILNMLPSPNFVEIITWNDGPESHYVGNIWPELGTDTIYATQALYPHTAWQPLITSFISAWKSSGSIHTMIPPANTLAVGAMWYKTTLQTATCPSSATVPGGWTTGSDSLNCAIVLMAGQKGMQVRAISNGVVLQTTAVSPGLNFGSPIGVQAGTQLLELQDVSGAVVWSATGGRCVSSGCPDGIYNMNYQVVGLVQGYEGASCS